MPFGRICGRKSLAAIGFHNKGHPYYITMQTKFIILPATLTPPGLPLYLDIAAATAALQADAEYGQRRRTVWPNADFMPIIQGQDIIIRVILTLTTYNYQQAVVLHFSKLYL